MLKDLPQSYQPRDFEDSIYQSWVENKYFEASAKPGKKPYTIVIPPPNVTGMLTMGHILNNTIQDLLIRYHRMDGFEACWIPGTDHASIATETKVVNYLADKKINKFEIGREKFLEYAWEWKEKYGGIIISQLKKLGASCDWRRERFTMDDGFYKAVIHAFVELYKKGYIYKGYRLVNWCPVSKSAISDEEVYYKEVQGKLYHFKYPIVGTKDFLEIATTRPETMLGDTAVAVNPSDARYTHLVGKKVMLPIVNKEIPIIADDYVDVEFGTGVVKITPAHDPNDYNIGKKYNLEFINILNDDATLNKNVPEEYRGLDRFEAREAVVQKMEMLKLVVKIENYMHKVGYSERGHVPIEPYLSDQWFMRMEDLVKPALKVVKDAEIKFYPDRWSKTYFHWLENIKDWCISRQLWWGHRIPVYYCDKCGRYDAYTEAPSKCPECGHTSMRQDNDVLDTWASSWLWPFAVHKWPDTPDADLNYFYPTDTLVTGPDIIFFWVARMIIAGTEFMGKIPFKRVYFTGIVRDEQGRKMSKSLGNSPDPLDVIREFGADALRYTMIRLAPLGNDIMYSNEKCELGRNFANKIWNATRYILSNYETIGLKTVKDIFSVKLDDFDKWMLTRLNKTAKKVREEIDEFRFNDSASTLYDFLWSELCDWYIEISKVALYKGTDEEKEAKMSVLLYVLNAGLRMLHPLMPFITEKLYLSLPVHETTIMQAPFPQYDDKIAFEKEELNVAMVQNLIYTVRNIRGENKIQPNIAVNVVLVCENSDDQNFITRQLEVVKKLAKVDVLEMAKTYTKSDIEAAGVGKGFEVFISLKGLVDIEKEREKFTKEIERFTGQIKGTKAKLGNAEFVGKAPEAVITKEKEKLSYLEGELEKMKKNLEALR